MINRYNKVQGHSDLVRDTSTGAILNTNKNEIARARELKEKKRQERQNMEALRNEVESMKQDFKDIKELLIRLVEEKDG